MTPCASAFQAWQQAIEHDGIDTARATVVRLAVDGLWLAELLGIWSPDGQLRTQVLHELIRLTQETPSEREDITPFSDRCDLNRHLAGPHHLVSPP